MAYKPAAILLTLSHPDYTVGSGLSPDLPCGLHSNPDYMKRRGTTPRTPRTLAAHAPAARGLGNQLITGSIPPIGNWFRTMQEPHPAPRVLNYHLLKL